MHASTSPFRTRSHAPAASLYSQVARESGVNATDRYLLIAPLFDAALDAISRARIALRDGSIEARGQAIDRAVCQRLEPLRDAWSEIRGKVVTGAPA